MFSVHTIEKFEDVSAEVTCLEGFREKGSWYVRHRERNKIMIKEKAEREMKKQLEKKEKEAQRKRKADMLDTPSSTTIPVGSV